VVLSGAQHALRVLDERLVAEEHELRLINHAHARSLNAMPGAETRQLVTSRSSSLVARHCRRTGIVVSLTYAPMRR
jgi:hypothetical protein